MKHSDCANSPLSGAATTTAPFVLLEDAAQGGARLYAAPRQIIAAQQISEVRPALQALRAAQARGLHAAGWMSYEAGFALEHRFDGMAQPAQKPLLWFGLFDEVQILDQRALEAALPDGAGAWITDPSPRLAQSDYEARVERILEYIRSGDIYQVNFTLRNDLRLLGHPLALYAQIRRSGAGRWSGVAFNGETWLLSTSPELFFSLEAGVIKARPMKGTAPRAAGPDADAEMALAMQADPKQRAENLMIVDLMRNDISRIAARGSVTTPALFTIETYPTLHTLTSTIEAALASGRDAIDALEALFPCGSITGAPKIRAMEIIDDLETDARGAYTGSLGWLAPNGDAAFNVLIRTLVVQDGREDAAFGVGSGIVHDSNPTAEWEECQVKSLFLTRARPSFDLIETMRYEPELGFPDLDLHLERLARSAETFGFNLDIAAITQALRVEAQTHRGAKRVRLAVTRTGAFSIESGEAPTPLTAPAKVALSALPVSARDFRLRHKTSDRGFRDQALAASGAFEVIFFDAEGFLTDGAFTNVFAPRGGLLLTPPASRALLPGVLRQKLLASGAAIEAELTPAELGANFFIGNALRGLIAAQAATE